MNNHEYLANSLGFLFAQSSIYEIEDYFSTEEFEDIDVDVDFYTHQACKWMRLDLVKHFEKMKNFNYNIAIESSILNTRINILEYLFT